MNADEEEERELDRIGIRALELIPILTDSIREKIPLDETSEALAVALQMMAAGAAVATGVDLSTYVDGSASAWCHAWRAHASFLKMKEKQ